MKRITLIFLTLFIVSQSASADTLVLRNGKRLKGLIVDNYTDRVVISTYEGEKVVMKADIRSVIYDSDAKVLLQKARNLYNRHKYVDAYYAYEKVLALDESNLEAKERYDYLKGYLESEMRYEIQSGVTKKEELFENAEGETIPQKVESDLGLAFSSENDRTYVSLVVKGSPADIAGVERGDIVISVWGELADYRDSGDVAEMFIAPGEMRIVVERNFYPLLSDRMSLLDKVIPSKYGSLIGAELEVDRKGVIISKIYEEGPFSIAAIDEGDLVIGINGVHTRYMPISRLIKLLRDNRGKRIELTVQRNITLWNKE